MIFVTVGTQKFQFNRLLRTIDVLVERGEITDDVFAQTGHSDYRPVHYKYSGFLGKEEFDNYIENCDLIITHSGVATIVHGLKNNKPVIVLPRLAKYGEHVDDHQLQIAQSFASGNYILYAADEAGLIDMIRDAKNHTFDKYVSQCNEIISTVKTFINNIEEENNTKNNKKGK